MELPMIDDKGQPHSDAGGVRRSCSGASTTRRWCTRWSPPIWPTRAWARARRRARGDVNKSNKKPWRQKGTGRARAGMASSPLWRGGGKIFPNSPDENFSQKVNRKMYRAGHRLDPVAARARRPAGGGGELRASMRPKTKLLAQKLKGMGLDEVLIITDSVDENLLLSSRNLPNVLVVEPRNADPVSLLRFEKTLITRGAVAKMRGDAGMSAGPSMPRPPTRAPDAGAARAAVSEKSTFVGEKNNQCDLPRAARTRPSPRSRLRSS